MLAESRSRPLTVHVSPDLHEQFDTCASLGKGTVARLVLERFAKRLKTNGNDFWGAFAEVSGALKIAEDDALHSLPSTTPTEKP